MNNSLPRILIVGASGFIGHHLLERLAQDGCFVEGWSRSPLDAPLGLEDHYLHRQVDLLAEDSLPEPPAGGWDVVFQLAGESRPSKFAGGNFPGGLELRNTVRIAARVAEHVAEHSPGCRYILNSSAYVYAATGRPQVETDPTEPSGPYGLAKLLAEDMTQLHKERLHVTIVRPFNLIGAGMPQDLFATGLLQKLRLGTGPVELSVPDGERDLLDIRDAVEAYVAMTAANYPSGTVFNLCSGQAVRTSSFAGSLLEALGMKRELRFVGTAAPPMLGDNRCLRTLTAWQPSFQAADAAHSMLTPRGV